MVGVRAELPALSRPGKLIAPCMQPSDPILLRRLFYDRLSENERADMLKHLASCAFCQERYSHVCAFESTTPLF